MFPFFTFTKLFGTFLQDDESNQYKNDNTPAERVGFYLLLALNLTALGMAGKNIYNGIKKYSENQIRKLILFNALVITVIISNLADI